MNKMRDKKFKELMDSSVLNGRDYTKYNIKEKVDNLISQPDVSAEMLLGEINTLPDVGYIKSMKQTVQLLHENGFLNVHNFVAVTNRDNFSVLGSIHSRLTHFKTANLLTQENIDWVLTPSNDSGKQALEIEMMAKNNQLTEKNLEAYKSGKIKDLMACQLITSPSRPESFVLNSRNREIIYDCGQASATLGYNTFEPSMDLLPRLEVINNPITHTIMPINETNPLGALLTFALMLQIFKGANFFPNSFNNAPNPESDPLTKIENNLIDAFKIYREMDEMDEETNKKASTPGIHQSCFFWREKGEENTQLEKTTTTPKPLR